MCLAFRSSDWGAGSVQILSNLGVLVFAHWGINDEDDGEATGRHIWRVLTEAAVHPHAGRRMKSFGQWAHSGPLKVIKSQTPGYRLITILMVNFDSPCTWCLRGGGLLLPSLTVTPCDSGPSLKVCSFPGPSEKKPT